MLDRLTLLSSRFGFRILAVVVLAIFISLLFFNIIPVDVKAADSRYLFDRTIQWDDGTTERIQIDNDSALIINGEKRYLIGMCMGGSGYDGTYFEPSNLALIEKEVVYLKSVGVRTIQVLLPYEGPNSRESVRYRPVLDIMYKNKMLVMPLFTMKWVSGFGNLQNPDIPLSGDSLSSLVSRWCSVVKSYPNVIAIYVENELDLRINGQTYDGPAAGAYMQLLTRLFRNNVTLPLLTKVMGYFPGGVVDQIKENILPYVDIPAFDIYQSDAVKMAGIIDRTKNWLSARGYNSTKWWAGEYNAVDLKNDTTTSRLNSSFLESTFSRGIPLVHLWVAHRVNELAAAFFDASGNPVPALVNIAQDFSRLQAPVARVTAVPVVTTLTAGNVYTTGATLNASLTSLGSATSISVSFDYGLTKQYGQSITGNPSPMADSGNFTAHLTGLQPGTTYQYRAKAIGDGTAYGIDISFTTPNIEKLTISTSSLSSATVGIPYAQSLIATGGVPSYNWTIVSGSLPQGLDFNSTGIISGKPSAGGGPVTVTFSVEDSMRTKATKSFTFTVLYPPWDINRDNSTNILDIILINQQFGQTGANGWILEDVNGDGTINALDLILVGQHLTDNT